MQFVLVLETEWIGSEVHIMTSFPAGHTHTRYEGKLSMPSPSYPSTPPPSSSSSSRTLAIVSVPLAVVALSAPFLLIGYKRKLPFLPTAVKPIKEALHVISQVRAARGILPKSRGTNSNNCKNATPWKLLDLGVDHRYARKRSLIILYIFGIPINRSKCRGGFEVE